MEELVRVVIRCILSLVCLFLVTKVLGKKQVSQLSLFDYVIGISIGNFAAEISINLDAKILSGIIAVIIFGLFAYIVSWLTMKSIILRRYFTGTPTVLIDKGNILYDGLKKVKFDVNDLLQECRIGGYFDVSEIECAVLEVNGTLSILPKSEYKPLTAKDMNIKADKQGLVANVIIDGKIMLENLSLINKDIEWLDHELKVKGKKVEDILLGTIDVNDKITIFDKINGKSSHNTLE